jgi:hypothetical protein
MPLFLELGRAFDLRLRIQDFDGWLKHQSISLGDAREQLYQEDQGRTPCRALLELLTKLEYRRDSAERPEFSPAQFDIPASPLTSESEQAILAWCAMYGLLGVLPHRVLQVVFTPRAGVQLQYVRIGIGWTAVERHARNPMTPILQPSATVQPLRGVGITVEPLSATWTRFFPDIAADERDTFAYLEPLTIHSGSFMANRWRTLFPARVFWGRCSPPCACKKFQDFAEFTRQ